MIAPCLPRGLRAAAPTALLLTLLLLLLAGCGGGDDTSAAIGPDPATVAPANAALYGEVVVRPSGAMKDDLLAAMRKVLRVEDPAAELRRALDDGSPGTLDFSRDVEPWLGERVGGFLLMPADGAEDPDGAIAIASTDRDALDEALARVRSEGDLRRAGSYGGVAYDRDPTDDTYSAPVGDFLVVGTLTGLRAAIDASRGDSLASSSAFTDVVDDAPDDALALLYSDPRAIVAGAGSLKEAPPATRRALAQYADADPVLASVTANADEIAIEGTGDADVVALDDDADGQVSVGQLPGDAWLALATPPLGPVVRNAIDGAGLSGVAEAQVRQAVGLDLEKDLLGPLGGLGLFVRGESLLDVGGGALLQMTDAAAAQRLLTRIQAIVGGAGIPTRPVDLSGARGFQVQIPQSPQPVVVLAKGDKLAAGYAASSAQDLLDPQQRFDDSSAGKAAIATLGDGYTPSFVLVVPPLAGLLRSLDQLQVADLADALPYVSAYRSLAVGTKDDGDRASFRVVAALR